VRRPSGFTIVEIVVVLLLMSILAATVIGRSITSSDLDLNSATDKIRNQIRYAQSQAMKRTDAVWGMIPKGRLGRAMLRKLKVYKGSEHPHEAQKPELLSV